MVSPLGVGAAWLAPPGAKPPGYEVTVGRSMLRPMRINLRLPKRPSLVRIRTKRETRSGDDEYSKLRLHTPSKRFCRKGQTFWLDERGLFSVKGS